MREASRTADTDRGRRMARVRSLSRPMIPREHGAWAMLFVPFGVAVGVAWRLDLKVLLFLLATFSFYVARAPLEKLIELRSEGKDDLSMEEARRWLPIYLASGLLFTLPLLHWRLWWLIPLGALLLGFLVLHLYLTRKGAHRSLWGRFLGVLGLTAVVLPAYYVAKGALDITAFALWVLNSLFFGGSLFYVRLRVRRSPGKGRGGERASGLRKVAALFYHLASLALMASLGYLGWLPLLAFIAYIPSAAQTMKDLVKPEGEPSLRRIGFIQLGHALIFALLLIGAYRAEGLISIGR